MENSRLMSSRQLWANVHFKCLHVSQ